ncbi:hypothetical protein AYI69_g11424, partial [Smittium culicis]
MNRPIVDDRRFSPLASAQKYVVNCLRHTQVATGVKKIEFLVDDFHVRQALGSPECGHTHFSNVLKAQLQSDRLNLEGELFDPPGTPGHPCGHPGLHWCLDE